MRPNRKHTDRDLERYILLYLDEGINFRELREEYGLLLSDSAFRQIILRYQDFGFSAIQTKAKNNQYTKTFKMEVIREYLEEEIPIAQLARRH